MNNSDSGCGLRRARQYGKAFWITLIILVVLFFVLPMIVPEKKHPITELSCRLNCESNLKQIALACKMYQGDYGILPKSFLDMKPYLPPRRMFVCPHYFAYNIKGIGRLEKTDPDKLLYTSYDYLGPDGETDVNLGTVIVIREKIHHPTNTGRIKSLPEGHYVVTKDFEVKFEPDEIGKGNSR